MKKESIINLIAQVFVLGVNLCISFFLVPYITKVIGVDAYGFVGLSNDFVGYAQIITIAINSMASRFITIKLHEGKVEEANKYYSSVVISNLIISIILAFVGAIIIIFLQDIISVPSNLLFDVKILFVLIFANFIISIITSTFSVATFCTNKLYLSSIKTIISQIIRVSILFGCFLLFKPSVYYIGVSALVCTSYIGYCNYKYSKSLTPELKISKEYFDMKYMKTLFLSGIWNTISKISNILSSGLDLLMSNIFIGPIGMGLISISKTLPHVILNAFGSLTSVFMPELTISYAKKDYEGMKHQLLFTIKLLGVFSAIPLTVIFAYGIPFYKLWMPTQSATLLFALTCVSLLELCICLPLEPLWNIFTVTNQVKKSSLFLLMNSILTIIIVAILLSVVPNLTARMFIILGVSAVIGIIRNATFLPIYGAKCINLKTTVFYPSIGKNLLTIVLSTFISIIISKVFIINSWLKLIIAVIITCILTLGISLMIITNVEDRKNIKKFIYLKLKHNVKESL